MNLHVYLFIFQVLSLNFEYLDLGQYLELWKVTICKTTGLIIFFWEQIYIFPLNLIKWKNSHESYSISISPFFIGRPVVLSRPPRRTSTVLPVADIVED